MRNAYLSAALLLVLGGAVGGTSSSAAVSQGQASVVPVPWAVEDPADSLYRAARDALNRNDYTRAADLFRKIRDTYPKSQYTPMPTTGKHSRSTAAEGPAISTLL